MMAMDSGMLVVLIIVAMYMSIVFMLLFFVKNEWCDILNSNLTVSGKWFEKIFNGKKILYCSWLQIEVRSSLMSWN